MRVIFNQGEESIASSGDSACFVSARRCFHPCPGVGFSLVRALGLTSFLAVSSVAMAGELFQDRFEAVFYVPLNDTGVSWCRDAEQIELDCPVAGWPAQDGEFGRDALARLGQLPKQGSGAAGFDFTRLGADGADLPSGYEQWSCVRDNHTGLVWEVKRNDPDRLQHRAHTYTWFDQNPDSNGGGEGSPDGGQCAGSACDTQSYVAAINAMALCGFSDWRLPTVSELHSIMHLGVSAPPIDTDFFPHTQSFSDYWTGVTRPFNTGSAWVVSFWLGSDLSSLKSNARLLRLVRGARDGAGRNADFPEQACWRSDFTPSAPSGDFRRVGDGSIVAHDRTGLEWQRCTLGQTWNGVTCTGDAEIMSWPDAIQRADQIEGWRLPNAKELRTLVEFCLPGPAINRQVFPATQNEYYHSNTPRAGTNPPGSWSIFFGAGSHIFLKVHQKGVIRLVRDPGG